jgi:hypothetical protein
MADFLPSPESLPIEVVEVRRLGREAELDDLRRLLVLEHRLLGEVRRLEQHADAEAVHLARPDDREEHLLNALQRPRAVDEGRLGLADVRAGLHQEQRPVGADVERLEEVVHLRELGRVRRQLAALDALVGHADVAGLIARRRDRPLLLLHADLTAAAGAAVGEVGAEVPAVVDVVVLRRLGRRRALADRERRARPGQHLAGLGDHLVQLALLRLEVGEVREVAAVAAAGGLRWRDRDVQQGAVARERLLEHVGGAPAELDLQLRREGGQRHADLQVGDPRVRQRLELVGRVVAEHGDRRAPARRHDQVAGLRVEHVAGHADAAPGDVGRDREGGEAAGHGRSLLRGKRRPGGRGRGRKAGRCSWCAAGIRKAPGEARRMEILERRRDRRPRRRESAGACRPCGR